MFYRPPNDRGCRIADSFAQIFLLRRVSGAFRRRRFACLGLNLRGRLKEAFGRRARGRGGKNQINRRLIRSGGHLPIHNLNPEGLVERVAENNPGHRNAQAIECWENRRRPPRVPNAQAISSEDPRVKGITKHWTQETMF
jgi:hypothetical protein